MQDLTQPISRGEIKRRIEQAARRVDQLDEQIAYLHDRREAVKVELEEAKTLKPVPKPRIDTLVPGQRVRLFFASSYGNQEREEDVTFLRIEGEGDNRRACFESDVVNGPKFEWDAYRYDGHWAYGSSADRLVLVSVLAAEEVTA